MRYPRTHKQATKDRILASAARLFSAHGFDKVSIEAVMRDCNLTRGGFYAHFRSKSHLYRESLQRIAANRLAAARASREDAWIEAMLDQYLESASEASADGNRLAFLISDIASSDPDVRSAYGQAFKSMSDAIASRMAGEFGCEEDAALSIAAMMIGAAAVARSIDDVEFKAKFLSGCKKTARALIENKYALTPPTFFWERTAR